jgi:hypothetical protein
MNSPFNNGSIRQQDIADRNIARQRIAAAIEREAARTGILVTSAIQRIEADTNASTNIDLLWNRLQRDLDLTRIQSVANQNTADYPGFEGWLNGSRRRIETTEKARLRKVVSRRNHQYRYANTVGFQPAFVA